MANATGTSVIGAQTLLNNVTVVNQLLSIGFPGNAQPPVKRYGYFYLYTYETSILVPHYIVEEGLVRKPGLLIRVDLAPLSSSYKHRLDVVWSVPGIAWAATLI